MECHVLIPVTKYDRKKEYLVGISVFMITSTMTKRLKTYLILYFSFKKCFRYGDKNCSLLSSEQYRLCIAAKWTTIN